MHFTACRSVSSWVFLALIIHPYACTLAPLGVVLHQTWLLEQLNTLAQSRHDGRFHSVYSQYPGRVLYSLTLAVLVHALTSLYSSRRRLNRSRQKHASFYLGVCVWIDEVWMHTNKVWHSRHVVYGAHAIGVAYMAAATMRNTRAYSRQLWQAAWCR